MFHHHQISSSSDQASSFNHQHSSSSDYYSYNQSFDDNSKNTLWMGELDPWLDEPSIKKIWAAFGETVNVKLIREKFTGATAGYCFVEFSSPSAASKALTLNGQPIPNSQRLFKLNWASGGGLIDGKRDDKSPEYSIFVGDLASEVTEFQLLQLFQYRYSSCKSAKIMTDPQTNTSRGYGFVRFSDESEMQRALTEMQGFFCGPRPMRVSTATPKVKASLQSNPSNLPGPIPNSSANSSIPGIISPSQIQSQNTGPSSTGGASSTFPAQNMSKHIQSHSQSLISSDLLLPNTFYNNNSLPSNPNSTSTTGLPPQQQQPNQFTDPNNTTVFVGGLSSSVTEDDLRHYFAGFGDITYVKIPSGKGCGFVQYVQRSSAETAITKMQGYPIGSSRVRLSWGRSQNNNNNTNQKSIDMSSSMNPMNVNMGMNMSQMGMNVPMNINNSSVNVPPLNNNPMNIPNNLLPGPYPPANVNVYPPMSVPSQQQQQQPFGPFGSINPPMSHIHSRPVSATETGQLPSSSSPSSIPSDSNVLSSQIGIPLPSNSTSLAASAPGQDPNEPDLVARLNQLYLAARDGRLDRVEGDGRGYHGVYAQ